MVARFQSIISAETKKQLRDQFNCDYPDIVMACVGGGSNAMGMFYHFLEDTRVRVIGVEAAGQGVSSGRSAATTALGTPGVLHGSKTLLMQTKDGQVEEAHSISAGLDYPGIGPQHAHLHVEKRVEYVNVTDEESLRAAAEVTRLEGILPALESAHAFAYLPKMTLRPTDTVVLCLSGRGDKDLKTYIERLV